MAVSSVTNTSSATSGTSSTSNTNNVLTYESFLKLLTSEMQNQDPTDPVSNTEYIGQLCQIASLQQLNSLSLSTDSSRAYSMLGKNVSYQTTDSSGSTTTASGTVQSVVNSNGITYLYINGTKVELSSVLEVSNESNS